MWASTIATRFATATLLGMLAFGASGAGTAAAASRNAHHSSIKIAVTPASDAAIDSGTTFTDTIVVSNQGGEGAKDDLLTVQFDPGVLQLQGVQFNQAGTWVSATMPNGFLADLGSIGSNGGSTTLSASFMTLAGYSASNPVRAQLHTTWRDSSGSHNSTLSAALLESPDQAVAPVASAANGVVPVLSAIFNPGEPVTLWYNLPNGTAATLYLRDSKLVVESQHREHAGTGSDFRNVDNAQSLLADSDGQISTRFATAGLVPGAYSIVAHGARSGITAVFPFTVP